MKKLLLPLIVVLFWYSQSQAQVPEGLNYQAVARDGSGNVRSNETIIVRFTLQPGVATTPTWIETDTAQTDGYGVFTLTIGAGTKTGGTANSFAEIDFSEGDYWIKVEVKEGGNFVIVGSLQKFLSVPYAFMSKTALKSQNDFDTSATNELQILKLSNDTLYLNQGGFVYLGSYDDKIEIQNVKDKSKSDSSYFDIKLNNEQSDRMTSDIVLGQKIISDSSYLRGMINSNSTNLVNETNSRIAGDNDLKSKQFSDSTYLIGLISTEIVNRSNNDYTLQTNISNIKSKQISDSSYLKKIIDGKEDSLNFQYPFFRNNDTIAIIKSSQLQDGYLNKNDWNNFNGKIGGKGTMGYIPMFQDTNLLNNSIIYQIDNSVGIGNNQPDSAAILDITSNTKGFLPPRMNDSLRNSMKNLTAGIIIYNSTTNTLNFFNGSYWLQINGTSVMTSSTALTLTPINITENSAILKCTANAGGFSSNVVFEYGLTTNYGNVIYVTQSPINGNSDINLSANISGLTSNTIYHYRVKVSNILGEVYGSDKTFITGTKDFDGNFYSAVQIGTQIWMTSNLKTTHYKNGNIIPYITNSTTWSNLTTSAYCNYNNDTNYGNTYGRLYNLMGVSDYCPNGWHVPNDAEWAVLETYLGGSSVAGAHMKETGTSHWASPNTGADNSSNFTGLPGGYRDWAGNYAGLTGSGMFWSKPGSQSLYLSYNKTSTVRASDSGTNGFSIRCIRD